MKKILANMEVGDMFIKDNKRFIRINGVSNKVVLSDSIEALCLDDYNVYLVFDSTNVPEEYEIVENKDRMI